MATLPTMTLAEIRTAVRQRADMVNSEFVTDSELDGYVNNSLYELYDLLVTCYGDDYYVADPYEFTTTTASTYDLPADFYKLLGVDLQASSGETGWVTLHPFNFIERNRNNNPGYTGRSWWWTLRYRLRAGKLWLTPQPQSGYTLRIFYVPKMTPLADPVTLTCTSVVNGNSFSIGGVSIIAGSTFDVGADDEETATNIATMLTDNPPVGLEDYGLEATSSDTVVTISQNTKTTATALVAVSATFAFSEDTLYPSVTDGISGWLEYVIVDAAIKCLEKQALDSSVFRQQKQGLIDRINTTAPNRDAGSPMTIGDVTADGGWFRRGWGTGFNGGW